MAMILDCAPLRRVAAPKWHLFKERRSQRD
jgi:hypothetical protein